VLPNFNREPETHRKAAAGCELRSCAWTHHDEYGGGGQNAPRVKAFPGVPIGSSCTLCYVSRRFASSHEDGLRAVWVRRCSVEFRKLLEYGRPGNRTTKGANRRCSELSSIIATLHCLPPYVHGGPIARPSPKLTALHFSCCEHRPWLPEARSSWPPAS
jgi:hypothetical protein